MTVTNKPYKLKNGIRNYPWGTIGSNSPIPGLAGITPDETTPYAELWIGNHPILPSSVFTETGEVPLCDFIAADPVNILGKIPYEKFGSKLPFLFKFISIGRALSIQTHPNKTQAEYLHKVSPENYPDSNHKPEIAIAVDNLQAVAGLRSLSGIKNVLEKYPPVMQLFSEELLTIISGLQGQISIEDRKLIYKSVLEADNTLVKKVISEVLALLESLPSPDFIEQTVLKEFEEYGYDPGLIALLLFNHINLHAGEAMYIPAGVPHAYLSGNIIECMANSDNVVRAGLTPKHKDIKVLLDILDYNFRKPEIISPEANQKFTYPAPADEFSVSMYHTQNRYQEEIAKNDRIKTFLLLTGSATIKTQESEYGFSAGDSFIIPALLSAFTLVLEEKSQLFVVDIP